MNLPRRKRFPRFRAATFAYIAQRREHPIRFYVPPAFTLLLLLVLAVWARPRVAAHLEALSVLKQVGGQPVPRMLQWAASEPVATQDLAVDTAAGVLRARMYTPVKHPHAPGLVVFHGVHHLGMDEPRLTSFARAMASTGLTVLTPELPDIKDYRVSEASIHAIGGSAKWLSQQKNATVGVMGLSFSGGLALVAAADPDFKPSMRFVFAVGSQGAMERVASYYRTGSAARPDGTTEILPAHEYGPLVLEYEHVEEFVPAADVEPIRAVLRAHLYEDRDLETSSTQALNATQIVEARKLMDATSDSTRDLLQASETRHMADMQRLSPGGHLHDLTVPVFLLHGEADNIIPAAETLWMANELRAETLQAALVSPMLSHLDMAKEPTLADQWRLVHFMAQVLLAAHR